MTDNNRNPGMPLDLDWVAGAHVNKSAVERRTATLPLRRTVKKDWQAAWLLRAVTCIDLTTLSGDDTPGRVKRLCAKARQPIRPDMLAQLGLDGEKITVGAVCVYKKEWQAAWLLRAVTCIDLTTLSGDDTPGRVKRLCAKARQPIRPDMLAQYRTGWREDHRRRCLRLSQSRGGCSSGAAWHGHSSCFRCDRFPRRTDSLTPAYRRDRAGHRGRRA